jgi:hypothetical protein
VPIPTGWPWLRRLSRRLRRGGEGGNRAPELVRILTSFSAPDPPFRGDEPDFLLQAPTCRFCQEESAPSSSTRLPDGLCYLPHLARGLPSARSGGGGRLEPRAIRHVTPPRFLAKAAGGGNSTRNHGLEIHRVAPGRCLPGAPTDPDVRISRIRFVKSRFRCVEQG